MRIILIISMLFFISCEGLIGLLEDDQLNQISKMNSVHAFDDDPCTYFVEVIGYYEPNAQCGVMTIDTVFYDNLNVWKRCGMGSLNKLSDPYVNHIIDNLHAEYLDHLECI